MKIQFRYICFAALLAGSARGISNPSTTLWFEQPAKNWESQALPLGNGRLGCMVFGGVEEERIQFNVDSLWTGDENPAGGYDDVHMGAFQNFGDLYISLKGGGGVSGVTCPSGHKSFYPYESLEASVDGKGGTKWCVEHGGKPVIWQCAFPEPRAVKTYRLTSGRDVPARDPRDWMLMGSTDGEAWLPLDEQRDQVFSARGQKRSFENPSDTAYRYYRLVFKPGSKVPRFQLAEIALGALTPPVAAGRAEAYRRELDISRGLHRVAYTQCGVKFSRELFCSAPGQVIAIRLSADRPGQYSGKIRIADGHGAKTLGAGQQLRIQGKLGNGLEYVAGLSVVAEGGRLKGAGDALVFDRCDSLTLYLAAETSYLMDYTKNFKGNAAAAGVDQRLKEASAAGFTSLKSAHLADHARFFDRVAIDLGTTAPEQVALPMDRRRVAYAEGTPDPDLEEMLFQMGRYLLMGSSRPGCLPANLQGLWNNRNNPPWHSDYHSNINLQMNYWLAEPANLGDCHRPLMDYLMAMREPYRTASRKAFGEELRGFTCRTSQNIHGGMGWKWNIPASAWYAQHFWEHYAFGQDKTYLREVAYPWLKEVCQYWEDHLKELPPSAGSGLAGRLVAPNGWSPEHGPTEDGVAHDQQIIWDLFSNYMKAADALNVDADYRKTIAGLRDRLVGPKIGTWGQLQEWMEDRDNPKDQHRHTSHLYAVYPGVQISRARTPAFAKAAEISLEARGEAGDSRRSWTWPWRCAMWARFGKPEKCHHMIHSLLKYNMLDNLLATHPPMQLDGSFGITAGMCEMLLQSHAGEVHLLPALPVKHWPNGSVKGLRARGGFEVDVAWEKGQLTQAVIRASVSGPLPLRYEDQTRIIQAEKGGEYRF